MADKKKIEGHCSTGQSPQWAVVSMEEEECPYLDMSTEYPIRRNTINCLRIYFLREECQMLRLQASLAEALL